MIKARIFQRPRTVTQAGRAEVCAWVLDYQQDRREVNDPLMGWWGSDSTLGQVSLRFDTQAEAEVFAQKNDIPYSVEQPPATRAVKPKVYADNFRYGRTENWTH